MLESESSRSRQVQYLSTTFDMSRTVLIDCATLVPIPISVKHLLNRANSVSQDGLLNVPTDENVHTTLSIRKTLLNPNMEIIAEVKTRKKKMRWSTAQKRVIRERNKMHTTCNIKTIRRKPGRNEKKRTKQHTMQQNATRQHKTQQCAT